MVRDAAFTYARELIRSCEVIGTATAPESQIVRRNKIEYAGARISDEHSIRRYTHLDARVKLGWKIGGAFGCTGARVSA